MDTKIISIVTPSYNQGQFIEETLQSVLAQEGDFYIDYIVMDGGSTDDSPEVIAKYRHLLQQNCRTEVKEGLEFFVRENKDFPWNRCLGISYRWESKRDNGQVDAINQGLRKAKGTILAFLNSDDLYYPHTLETVSHIPWNGVDFLYGQGMWISEPGKDLLRYPTFKPSLYSFFYQCTLCQPTVFFHRDTFRQLGNFSEKYPDVLDYEYWMRALFRQRRFFYIPRLLAKSRMYKDNKSMAQRNSISHQVGRLKQYYYSHSRQRLSKLKLFFTQFVVQRKTVHRVNKLLKYLGHDMRYNFWKTVKVFKGL